ncbi:MAG: UDP-2,3-diacylglucosamine diphosphatase [Haliea sp.]|nr:UDP-2,3-diacylglucosamine diphosphatase [Haliea sp.]
MSSTLFISDLHLDPARPGVTRALADFLQQHSDCESLYILGDLFEAWVGDDDDSSLAVQVRGLLRDFSAAGPALYIMRGNRDFLLGEAFCGTVGAQLLDDPTPIDLHGVPTLLMHGDSLCTADSDYQDFRTTVTDPVWQTRVLARSLDQRRGLAAELRAMSGEANSNKAADIMDVTRDEVEKVMRAHGVRQLIHGHTHRPTRHEEVSGVRWVLGDWDTQGWAIEAARNKVNLYNFVITL